MAFVIKTATGFRSLAHTGRPNRCASNGIEPPPQNGSKIVGNSGKVINVEPQSRLQRVLFHNICNCFL